MAEKKLRVGIAGMTSDHVWGMARNLAALPAVELVAAAEPYEELLKQGRERLHIAATYADYRDMLAKEDLDAILVCCDNAGKLGIVEEAAKRGVHIYQDKPMAATLAQADRMVSIARQSGIKLMVAYHTAFSQNYSQIREWVQGGAIGQIYLARAIMGHAGPKEIGCSPFFYEWLHDKAKNGGGTFIDEGCYSVSTLLDYLGPVAEVTAMMTQMGWRDYLPADVEDNSVAVLRFKSGALAVLDAKWGQIGPMPFGSSYHGVDGTILASREGVKIYSRKAGLPADMQGWVDLPIRPAPRAGWGTEPEYFVRCVLEDRPFEGPVSPEGARATQEVIEAVYRSAETGQVVKLPL